MTEDWAQYILKEFPEDPPKAKITLLEDPDCLLAEESIFSELFRRGYRVHLFTRTIELRWFYETFVREDETAKLLVILRNREDVETVIPPDIRDGLQSSRISLTMPRLFPHLDCGVLNTLERRHIQELFALRQESEECGGGQEETCEFIFENLLGISISSVINSETLLDRLYHIHVLYALQSPFLLTYFQEHIRRKAKFRELREGGILASADHFHIWLGYAWNTGFLKQKWQGEPPMDAGFVANVDFGNRKVKNVLQALFDEDWLEMSGSLPDLERQYAYLADGRSLGQTVLDMPLKRLLEQLPQPDGSWAHWTRFAREWAALTAMKEKHQIPVGGFAEARSQINARFGEWLHRYYDGLASLPSNQPVTVQHVIRHMSRCRRDEGLKKMALIVLDGLAWNQWIPIRQSLENEFSLSVSGVFAQIPTLTSVSRQSIFSGLQPADFADTIETTTKEPLLWRKAWQQEGIDPARVKYEKGLGLGNPLDIQNKYYTGTEVLGLVIDTVDQFAHGTLAGNAEMHSRIRQWLEASYLKKLLHILIDELGFAVFLTSDHGNVECRGTQNIRDGILADMKGERVRVYPNEELREKYLVQCPQPVAWNGGYLPTDFYPMILFGEGAFAASDKSLVSHGGGSIEEVIVPFARIGRRSNQ